MSDPRLKELNGFKMRQRYLKWYLYLFKDEIKTNLEIGPFEYNELFSFVDQFKAENPHIRDLDKKYEKQGKA